MQGSEDKVVPPQQAQAMVAALEKKGVPVARASFYRSVPLPAHVAGDNASAVAEDGVLKISIPKASVAKPKTIKIKTTSRVAGGHYSSTSGISKC